MPLLRAVVEGMRAHKSALSPLPFLAQGDQARLSSFMGAIAIADLVKTTLGPKGMDKILQSVRRGRG